MALTTTAVALLNNPRKTREEINFLLNRCVRSPTFNRSLNPLVCHVTTSCSSLIDFGFIFCFLPRRRRCPPGPSYRSPSREELADLWVSKPNADSVGQVFSMEAQYETCKGGHIYTDHVSITEADNHCHQLAFKSVQVAKRKPSVTTAAQVISIDLWILTNVSKQTSRNSCFPLVKVSRENFVFLLRKYRPLVECQMHRRHRGHGAERKRRY